jgi:Ca2+-binding RTX toxin-like protein
MNQNAEFQIGADLQYLSAGHLLHLSGFEKLNGGTDSDTFIISGTRAYDLHGGAGNDSIQIQ